MKDGVCFIDLCCNDATGVFTGRLLGIDIHFRGRLVALRHPIAEGVYFAFDDSWFRVASRSFYFVPGSDSSLENIQWSRIAVRLRCAIALVQYLRTRGFSLAYSDPIAEFADVVEGFRRHVS